MKVVLLDEENKIETVREAKTCISFVCNGDNIEVIASGRISKEYLENIARNCKRIMYKLIKENYNKWKTYLIK